MHPVAEGAGGVDDRGLAGGLVRRGHGGGHRASRRATSPIRMSAAAVAAMALVAAAGPVAGSVPGGPGGTDGPVWTVTGVVPAGSVSGVVLGGSVPGVVSGVVGAGSVAGVVTAGSVGGVVGVVTAGTDAVTIPEGDSEPISTFVTCFLEGTALVFVG